MTVKDLFIEMLKLILKGKGNYLVYYDDWISGVLPITDEDNKMRTIRLW